MIEMSLSSSAATCAPAVQGWGTSGGMYKNSFACQAPAGCAVYPLTVLYIRVPWSAALSPGAEAWHIAAMPPSFGPPRPDRSGAPARLYRAWMLAGLLCAASAGCKGAGEFLRELLRERP